jgi:CPA2 family monovalent cation:H+ antiporter-2
MVLVITLPGAADIRRITQTARKMNPHLHIIIRTRFVNDMQDLFNLGADEVIPEEFETSVEIFTRVLAKYLIPREKIENLVAQVRSDGYEMFRSLSIDNDNFGKLNVKVPEISINTMHVCSNARIKGKTLGQVAFEKSYGVTLLAVSRENQTFSKPSAEFKFRENDILFFLASSEKLSKISSLFSTTEEDCDIPG